MDHKIIKAGTHSLAVIIPAEFVHSLGASAGDTVKIITDKEKGKVTVFFSGVMQLPLTASMKKNLKKP